MDEFLLELQAKLDEAKSKGLISADIEKIQQQLDKLKLNAEINPKSISNITRQLESIIGEKITIGLTANIDNNAMNQIKKASDSATNAVIQNEKKKQEAYKATADAVVYHAGVISKLNKAETNGRFYGSNRGTGYYGTGHYFVDSATKRVLDSSSEYSKLPYTSVDISQYENLFKANTNEIARQLHDFLKNLTRYTQGSDKFNTSELFTQFEEVFGNTVLDIKEFENRLEQLKTFMSNSSLDDRSDSVSTQFMKSLGYGGVDTRGTRYANTSHGIVIYDLKEESILQANITDELRKQGQMLEKIDYSKGQVFDKEIDERIQSQINGLEKIKEIKEEAKKLFDETNLKNSESELNATKSRLEEIDSIIANCLNAIDNAEKEAKRFAKETEEFGLSPMSESEIQDFAKENAISYQERVNELSLERAELEKRLPILEENYIKEIQLSGEAFKQAQQIVEQRHLEAQEASEAANTIIQNEEKKQQAIQETVKLSSELASFNEQFKETGIATVNEDGVVDMKKSLEEVRKIYSDFGKVTIKNEMTDLAEGTEQFRVSIEQSNGELKRTESFLMKLSEDGKSFVFADDMIKSSESVVRHLNEQKDATDKVVLAQEKAERELQAQKDAFHKKNLTAIDYEIQKREEEAKAFSAMLKEQMQERENLTAQTDKIQLSLEAGDFEAKILGYKTSLEKLGLSSEEVTAKMNGVNTAFDELKTSAAGENIIPDNVITKAEVLDNEMSKLANTIKQIKLKESLTADDLKVEQTIIRLNNQLQANSRYTKEAKAKIKEWIAELNKGNVPEARLKQINVEVKQLHSEMAAANKVGLSFFDQLGSKLGSLSAYISASTLLFKTFSAAKNGISSVTALDTALVDLKKTTDATAQELEDFYYSANDTAKQLGVTTEAVISATSAWSRLGYSIKEAQIMAENSAILTSISPDIDSIEDSTDALVSVLKAYKINAEDSLDGVISKINIIGNTQAVSNGDLVEILTRSSSAMAEANNTLEQTIALGTAATEITRDAAGIGQVLKTTSMRIRGYDEETESYSEDLEELKGKIADLTKTAKTPGGISLFTDETKQTYKSTYDILKDISEIYDELSDKNQAELLEVLAGKRNGQAIAAIISNFSAAEKSMDSMANSAGNAMKEMEVIYDSVDYRLNKMSETATGIAQNLFQREDMKNVLDVLNSFMNLLDKATEKLGLFGTAAAGLGMFAGIKNIGKTYKCTVSNHLLIVLNVPSMPKNIIQG